MARNFTITSIRNRATSIAQECGLWLEEAAIDIRNTAVSLVSGRLLKKVTGKLANSIGYKVSKSTLTAEIGTSAEEGVIWEVTGVKGPIRVNQLTGQNRSFAKQPGDIGGAKHRAILIMKGASLKGGQGSQIRMRQATYTRVTYKPPVRFLAKAAEQEMLGQVGRARLNQLGVNVGLIAADEIIQSLQRAAPGGALRVSSL